MLWSLFKQFHLAGSVKRAQAADVAKELALPEQTIRMGQHATAKVLVNPTAAALAKQNVMMLMEFSWLRPIVLGAASGLKENGLQRRSQPMQHLDGRDLIALKQGLADELREFKELQNSRLDNSFRALWEGCCRQLGINDEVRIWREWNDFWDRGGDEIA